MEQTNIQTLYVDNIEPKSQGQAININSSSSSGQQVNLMGSLLYNSSYANQGTVNYGRQIIICGHMVSSTFTLNQSGGINTIGNPATAQYQLSFPSNLFTTQPYAIVSPANAVAGSYNIVSSSITSSAGPYRLNINTYTGSTGSTASNPVLATVDFSFIIIGQSN